MGIFSTYVKLEGAKRIKLSFYPPLQNHGMALFSFRHLVKTFSDKRSAASRAAKHGQTAAHLKYVTRPKAARVVIRARLANPTDALIAVAAERTAGHPQSNPSGTRSTAGKPA